METKDYNEMLSKRWANEATQSKAELVFALSSNDNGEVFAYWDNQRGNDAMIDYLKQVVTMLEKNKNKNFSSGN